MPINCSEGLDLYEKGDLIMMDSLNFIKKYKVIKMGGHRGSDKTLCTFDDLNTAIRWAKKQIINRDRLAVFEYRYTSEENLKKDFHFDYSLKWAAYL